MSAVMIASWNETTLPNLLSNYKLENVFNADEFGLLYQHLPTKTYHLQAQLGKSYPCLLSANPKHHDALKILSNSLVDIEARRKVG